VAAPFLPITPSEATRLAVAVNREAGARGGARVPENVAVALVRVMRAEGPLADSPKRICRAARHRARRVGVLGGIGGFTTRALGETAGVLEGARVVVGLSDAVRPGRSEEDVAADLLVLLGAASSHQAARAAMDGSGPSIAADTRRRFGERVPEQWTVSSSLRFLWRTYRDANAVRDTVKPTRLIPGVASVFGFFGSGREMTALCKRTQALLAASAPA
jgi:hypothetical protein